MYAGPLSPAWVPSAQPLLPIHSCVGQSLTEAHSAGCSGCWCSVCLQGDLPAPGPTAPTPKPHILMRTLEHRPVTHLGAARKPWPGVRLSVCVSTCPEKPAARGRGEPMYMCCSLAFPRLRGPRESSQSEQAQSGEGEPVGAGSLGGCPSSSPSPLNLFPEPPHLGEAAHRHLPRV